MILCLLAFACLIPNIVEGSCLYDKPSFAVDDERATWFTEIPGTGYCYWAYGFSDSSYWDDKPEWCEDYGSKIAYIESIEEWDLVKGYLDNFMNQYDSQNAVIGSYWPYAGIWLGGSAGNSGYDAFSHSFVPNTGNFSWVWTDGSPVNFMDWAPNQPNISAEACIMAYQPDGWKWHSLDCHVFGKRILPTLCKQPVRCGEGWIESNKTTTTTITTTTNTTNTTTTTTEGTCYKILNETMVDWETANKTCVEMGMNITLAVIQDSDADYLSGLLVDNHVSNGKDGFWIGPKNDTGCYYMEEDMQTGNNNTPNHYTKKKAPNCNQGKHHPICEKKWSRIELWQ